MDLQLTFCERLWKYKWQWSTNCYNLAPSSASTHSTKQDIPCALVDDTFEHREFSAGKSGDNTVYCHSSFDRKNRSTVSLLYNHPRDFSFKNYFKISNLNSLLYYPNFSVSCHSNPLIIILAKYFPHRRFILGHSLIRNYLTSEPAYKVIISLRWPRLALPSHVISPPAQCCTSMSSLWPHSELMWLRKHLFSTPSRSFSAESVL